MFPETNIVCENWWLGDDPFLLGPGLFSGEILLVSRGHGCFSSGSFCCREKKMLCSVAQWNFRKQQNPIVGGFLKWWYPTTMSFPIKHDHFGVFWGYHHLRKHQSFFPVVSGKWDVGDRPSHGSENGITNFLVGGWTNPFEKICSSIFIHFPPGFGMKIKDTWNHYLVILGC